MIHIKTYEGLFDYFKKDNRDKRDKKRKIYNSIRDLASSRILSIEDVNDRKLRFIEGYEMKGFIINDDMTIDVPGNIIIDPDRVFRGDNEYSNKELLKHLGVTINFRNVGGFFYMENCNLGTSLKGLPIKVGGNLILNNNGIDSLINLPTKEVRGSFECGRNNLKNLEGCPNAGMIYVPSNDIYTLDFLPKCRDININDNPIELLVRNIISDKILLDLFINDYDPIRPPEKEEERPILIFDRYKDFMLYEMKDKIDRGYYMKIKNSTKESLQISYPKYKVV